MPPTSPLVAWGAAPPLMLPSLLDTLPLLLVASTSPEPWPRAMVACEKAQSIVWRAPLAVGWRTARADGGVESGEEVEWGKR
jgi:hypothetical protein